MELKELYKNLDSLKEVITDKACKLYITLDRDKVMNDELFPLVAQFIDTFSATLKHPDNPNHI